MVVFLIVGLPACGILFLVKRKDPVRASETAQKEIITILRAVHKYKDSREQFEQRTHKRLIEIKKPSQKVVEALMSVDLPAGVDIDVKL